MRGSFSAVTNFLSASAIAAGIGLATPAMAQEDASALDRIEVTGSQISYRDLLETPAIAITRPGDTVRSSLGLYSD